MDEATTAVDIQMDDIVREAVRTIFKDKTVITIAVSQEEVFLTCLFEFAKLWSGFHSYSVLFCIKDCIDLCSTVKNW